MKYSQGLKHDYCSNKCSRSSKEVQKKAKQTCIERYGCENPAQNKEVREKVKQTNLERFGCEYASQNKNIQNKIKQTNLKKYNCENPFQSKKIKEKIKETCLERFGCENPSQNKEIKEKTKQTYKQTCIERYGCENVFQNKNIQNKIKQTNLKKYNCENPFQSKKIKEKIKETCLERYGCEYATQSKEVQEKYKQTCIEKYGCENVLQNKEIREKGKQTCIEKYGCKYPFQNKDIQKKIKQTCIEKYGCEYPAQNEKVKRIHYNKSYDYLIPKFIEHGITPLFSKEEYEGYDKIYKWKCLICQNEFEQKIRATGHVEECPHLPHCWNCYPRLSGESKSELELLDFVKQYFPTAHKDKVIIKPYELDIVIDELKLAIEFNGDYWHSTEFYLEHHDNLDEYYNYHLNKTIEANEKGYRLIHIWENESNNLIPKLKDILEGKENLNFTEDVIKLDRSWYNNAEIPGYELVEELPPEIVNRVKFNVENCGYLVYKRLNSVII